MKSHTALNSFWTLACKQDDPHGGGLTANEWNCLFLGATRLKHNPNTMIISQGNTSGFLYYLEGGSVQFELVSHNNELHGVTLDTITGPGIVFGDFSMFRENYLASFNVITTTAVILRRIPVWQVFQFLSISNSLAARFYTTVGKHISKFYRGPGSLGICVDPIHFSESFQVLCGKKCLGLT